MGGLRYRCRLPLEAGSTEQTATAGEIGALRGTGVSLSPVLSLRSPAPSDAITERRPATGGHRFDARGSDGIGRRRKRQLVDHNAAERFAHDIDRIGIRFESFMEEFSNILQRQLR